MCVNETIYKQNYITSPKNKIKIKKKTKKFIF